MAYGIPGGGSQNGGRSYPQTPMHLPKQVVRIGQQSIWSTQAYAGGAVVASTQDRIFAVARGMGGQGFNVLSLAETNQKESGRIPGGYAYDCFGVSLHPYVVTDNAQAPPAGITVGDAQNVVNNLILKWDFLQSQIEIAPAQLIGAGGGAFAGGGAAGAPVLTNSNGQVWLYNQAPVMLPSNATFGMILEWGQFSTPNQAVPQAESFCIRVNLMGRFQSAIAIG
jgi:hypothetical protein